MASQAVQQAQVGTLHLSIQSGNRPEPHYSVYRRYADAKAQALSFGGLVHHTPCGQYLEGKKQVLSDKQKQRLLSGTTIHEVHRLLRTAFQYAVEWGILVKSPVPVDSPKKSIQERAIWDANEMWAALASMEDPILHLAVHLTLVGALREGEVAGLTPEDLDFEGADGTGTFRINKCMQRVQKVSLAKTGKGCILQEFEDKREGSTTTLVLKKTKTASSNRTIFMTAVLKEELKRWLKRLEMDEAVDPERYRNSGMLLRLPNGLAVEPILARSSSSGRTSTRSSLALCFTACGIPVPPIN